MIPAPYVQVYDATGTTPLGLLGAVSELSISDVFCDLGSLTFSLPRVVPGAELLDTDEDRQVCVHQAGAPVMWFLLDEDSREEVSDDPASEVASFSCRSLAGLLDEAVVVPVSGNEVALTAPTPGEVVSTFFTAAQSRGLLQGLTLVGGGLTDASGAAWVDLPNVTYKAGQSLLEVVRGLASNSALEWRINVRDLELYKPAGGLDRTLDVRFRPGRDVTSAPFQRSRRSQATAVLVEGAAGSIARRTQTLTGRRPREVYVSQSAAPSGSLNSIGDFYLAAHAAADVQTSHELIDAVDGPVPWVDYRPGDRLLTLAGGTSVEARRVKQVVRKLTDTGSEVSLEMGSILEAAEERFDRQLRRLLPGEQALT